MTTHRRPPPAFQMYSSDRLADRQFKMMSLGERGLLHTLELECWSNGSVPAEFRALARIMGLEEAEIKAALSERVLVRFTRSGDDLISPELEAYRQKLDEHFRKKSEGGKKGMQARWGGRVADNSVSNTVTRTESNHPNNSLSTEKSKTEKSKTVARKGFSAELKLQDCAAPARDPWVTSFAGESETLAAAAEAYRRATQG